MPSGSIKKLVNRRACPFRILKKFGENTYLLEIPTDWGIYFIFNVLDLITYVSPPLESSTTPFIPSTMSSNGLGVSLSLDRSLL
ncbi:hypothetical protein KSP40_PGU002431 [Platanthera guangdongensis]|uniref:Tf2-1-like SH3-like domain-containing protein n=1 Tax=Platanthera guangdongensis TaxID=2320717 RepID=A0ABR2M3P0_9ASPA